MLDITPIARRCDTARGVKSPDGRIYAEERSVNRAEICSSLVEADYAPGCEDAAGASTAFFSGAGALYPHSSVLAHRQVVPSRLVVFSSKYGAPHWGHFSATSLSHDANLHFGYRPQP